jgi:nitrate reductase gamma subunit/ferredoxin
MSVDVGTVGASSTRDKSVAVVTPGLLTDLARFGATDVSACFSCGTCTAVCPLVDNDATFPRRIIRYGQLGLRDELLSSKELWTCYHCGLCTESCPQSADPAQYMAAARRYAIAGYDRTRLARTLYTHPAAGAGVATALAALFALFLYAFHGERSTTSFQLFRFIPEGAVHWTGVAVMALVALAALSGVTTMVVGIARKEGVRWRDVWGRAGRARSWSAAWSAGAVESLGQRRYREDCAEAQSDREPLYRRRWFAHAMTMWGFTGLLLATMSDYALSVVGLRRTGTPEPIWYPVRLLGTVAGVMLVYGVTVLLVNRLGHLNRATRESAGSDWLFLIMLWIVAVSGFLVELSLYVGTAPAWGYWIFLFHVSVALDLLVLLPFMKFAHALYRPVALFFHSLAGHATRVTPDV